MGPSPPRPTWGAPNPGPPPPPRAVPGWARRASCWPACSAAGHWKGRGGALRVVHTQRTDTEHVVLLSGHQACANDDVQGRTQRCAHTHTAMGMSALTATSPPLLQSVLGGGGRGKGRGVHLVGSPITPWHEGAPNLGFGGEGMAQRCPGAARAAGAPSLALSPTPVAPKPSSNPTPSSLPAPPTDPATHCVWDGEAEAQTRRPVGRRPPTPTMCPGPTHLPTSPEPQAVSLSPGPHSCPQDPIPVPSSQQQAAPAPFLSSVPHPCPQPPPLSPGCSSMQPQPFPCPQDPCPVPVPALGTSTLSQAAAACSPSPVPNPTSVPRPQQHAVVALALPSQHTAHTHPALRCCSL